MDADTFLATIFDQCQEQWRAISGYEDLYEISDHGRVRSRKGILKAQLNRPNGYLQVLLSKDAIKKPKRVHVLVLEAFGSPRPVGMICRHLDGMKTNNVPANLIWSTHSRNQQDVKWHKLRSNARLTPADVQAIKQRLQCSECAYRGLASELARQYGVSRQMINQIKNGIWHQDVQP